MSSSQPSRSTSHLPALQHSTLTAYSVAGSRSLTLHILSFPVISLSSFPTLLTSQSHATSTSIHVTLEHDVAGNRYSVEEVSGERKLPLIVILFLSPSSFLSCEAPPQSPSHLQGSAPSFCSSHLFFSTSIVQCPGVILCLRQPLHSHSKPSRVPPCL